VPTWHSDGRPLTNGESNYRANCASCHGIDRKGDAQGTFPSLEQISDRLPEEAVMQFMLNGSGRMPAFNMLPETRRQAILNFLFNKEEQSEIAGRFDDPEVPPYVFRGFQRWYDEEGYPAIKPPWGTLNAVDLNTGTIKWNVPLGEFEELTERGIPPTGTENYGGPIVTAGGVIFIGATMDRKFRAFDKDTGAMLWEADLPLDGNATPSTYMVDGKQFVVISAGGAKMNPPYGGTLVAFALRED
jgi:quinoprotein glucose dehydrogenase